MGNKKSVTKENKQSISTQERKRLTDFLKEKDSTLKFTFSELEKLWSGLLVHGLLDTYANFVLKSNTCIIGIDEFISLYLALVRGTSEEKAAALALIIGSHTNDDGMQIISYHDLCKYLSDLLDSYFIGLKTRNDHYYKSWTRNNEPRRHTIERIMRGVCNDIKRTGDEVRVDVLETWLHECGLVNNLHSYVLGSLYNLEPEQESDLIPLAELPSKKTSIFLDLSQVVYLNSFLPSEHKLDWRFLFSTASHGESFAKLVGCIVDQGPILFVIHTNDGNTFGGFISTNVTLSPKWIGSDTSFLFKLHPIVDVYPTTGYNNHYAYLNSHQSTLPNGLGMGGQYSFWGLWVDSHFGVGECSESCTTYKHYKILSSEKKFHIKGMEVWAVGEPPPTEEEMGERSTSRSSRRYTRGGRSALDVDPTSMQLMEMAGHTMHSKGIRQGSIDKTDDEDK